MKIEEIKEPGFLKQLNKKELENLCKDIRTFIIEVVASNGGHLSSNLGVVEATVALHYVFDSPNDKILFDVGHQSYTHKILTGRAQALKESLRRYNGISGYQRRNESIHDSIEAGHSSTVISLAEGLAVARKLNQQSGEIIAFIGDSSIATGLSFEALNNLSGLNSKVIIVLNDNEMSISKPVGALGKLTSKLRKSGGYQISKSKVRRLFRWAPPVIKFVSKIKKTLKSIFLESNLFEQLNIRYLGPYDGHDVKELIQAFKIAKNSKNSILIHINTSKGKGYPLAEKDTLGYWHGVEPFDINTGKSLKSSEENFYSWSQVISDIVLDQAVDNEDLVMITPAMITGAKMEKIFANYPNRSFDVGIAEEHAVTFAAGLALGGKLPYINIYSTFMQRAYDNLNHDVARMRLPMIIGVDRSGIVGEDGETHQGHYDVEITKGLPNSFIAMPYDALDAKKIFCLAMKSKKLAFIRFPRGKINPDINANFYQELQVGTWSCLQKGISKILIISTGPITNQVLMLLKNKYPQINLLFARFYRPLDTALLLSMIKSMDNLIVYDIYATKNALYYDICALLIENNINIKSYPFVLPNENIPHGKIEEVYDSLHLSLKYLDKKIEDLIAK